MDTMDPKTARKIYPHPNRLFAPLLLSRQRLCKGESFRAFCMHTSLHGWHYMVDRSARSPVNLQRTMWGAILLLAVVTAFTFLYNNTWVGARIHKYLPRRDWKRLEGCVFSPPSLCPLPARGREARKCNLSIASLPTPLRLV